MVCCMCCCEIIPNHAACSHLVFCAITASQHPRLPRKRQPTTPPAPYTHLLCDRSSCVRAGRAAGSSYGKAVSWLCARWSAIKLAGRTDKADGTSSCFSCRAHCWLAAATSAWALAAAVRGLGEPGLCRAMTASSDCCTCMVGTAAADDDVECAVVGGLQAVLPAVPGLLLVVEAAFTPECCLLATSAPAAAAAASMASSLAGSSPVSAVSLLKEAVRVCSWLRPCRDGSCTRPARNTMPLSS